LDTEFPKKATNDQDQTKTESDVEEEAMIDEAERLREEQAAASSRVLQGRYLMIT